MVESVQHAEYDEAVVPRERIVLLIRPRENDRPFFAKLGVVGKKFLRIATEYGDL